MAELLALWNAHPVNREIPGMRSSVDESRTDGFQEAITIWYVDSKGDEHGMGWQVRRDTPGHKRREYIELMAKAVRDGMRAYGQM